MLTSEQEKRIAHLSEEDEIKISPFDPSAEEKIQRVRERIREGVKDIRVEHCGATSLWISGQDEIDIYLPVAPEVFDCLIGPLTKMFGRSRSLYPLERARFVTEQDGKHVDVFLINQDHAGWINGVIFRDYLKSHPRALEEYRKIKEEGDGMSVRGYYRMKMEFINDILSKARQ